MRYHRIEYEYFEWLTALSSSLLRDYGEYRLLSEYLYSIEFYSEQGNDADRAEDGINLRMRFADEMGISQRYVQEHILEPCSVLEMMLALAIRCEENIMGEPGEEDNSGRWLYAMVESLRLEDMTDMCFDERYTEKRIMIFLKHRYECNGSGGLFTVSSTDCDMRNTDIWYQMCWYLKEITEQ